ncbi:cytochrome P450 [Candidatus Uabimicrobium amorphum]|uniref:Cytochrome P450 n=1 Tax=Uabimicrobium amorphum TaxID=2596890 RepID=A0A5S9F4S5_UABAM|nr:cytochrome P450 [Candidatus Uabimicrobium amorphum]BBM85413.1 cytochrome P450 [Candidatus Uabimicrobium amorphum]
MNEITGPKGRFISGNFRDIHKDMFAFFDKCIAEHGDIFKFRAFHVKCYVVNRPEYIEELLVKNHTRVRKPWDLRQLRILLGKGLLTNEGQPWLKQRRASQPSFQKKRIAEYAKIMAKHIEKHVDTWEDGEELDIHQKMMDVALYIAGETLFGTIVDDIENIERLLDLAMNQFGKMISGGVPLPLWFPTPLNLRMIWMTYKFDFAIMDMIRERKKNPQQANDLLSDLINIKYEDGSPISDKQVRDEIITLIAAGHETTAISLSWTLYLLAQHPEVKEKLFAEVDEVLAGRLPRASDMQNLTYTVKVMKESMRFYPPAWGLGREVTEDIEIAGQKIAKNSQVFVLMYFLHRDPRFYENPHEFYPERWTPEFEKQLHRYAYLPFGGGPRLCIGNHFAMMETTLLLAHMMQKCDFELVKDHAVVMHPSVTLRPKNGIRMIVHKRK